MEILAKFGFYKSGSFKQTKQKFLEYNQDPHFIDFSLPKVYVWLEKSNKPEIIYVGKTQFSIKKRMGQHKQGFKGKERKSSCSGSKKHKYLLVALNNGSDIEIWTRQSDVKGVIFNNNCYAAISHYSVEEEFFIQEFQPKLNCKIFLKQL